MTTNQAITGGNKLSVGLTGTLTPGATIGVLAISGVLINVPGEVKSNNNSDSDKVDYFQQ